MVPNIDANTIKKLTIHAQSIQKRIPSWFKQRLNTERKWQPNEVVKIKDDLNEDQYGIYNTHTLYQLRVNASGHGIPIGSPWNTKEWDLDAEFTKVSTWGRKAPENHTPAIRGAQHETYPPNEGWLTRNNQKVKLSDLTIKRMTDLFTNNTGPPSCQRKWEQILHTTIAWKKVWRTMSNAFSNPHDTKTWHKFAHRSLRLNSNDKSIDDRKCRLCKQTRESHAHLLTCSQLNPFRRLVLRLLQASGMNLNTFAYPQTWLTCLDTQSEPLNTFQVACITIHWNILYKHMTKQKLDNTAFLNATVMRDYTRTIADRILATIKKLSLHNQSRQYGFYNTQNVNASMENLLHTIGQYNAHS
eukprot:6213236-Pleurochrysis_carterae.AAC.1